MKKTLKEKYEGFSLVEMILTMFILGVVMLITATTLTTLIRVSLISEAKSTTRTQVDFMLEVVSRSLSSADLSNIELYNTQNVRQYNPEENRMVDGSDQVAFDTAYTHDSDRILGSEVHIKSYGFDRWTCMGYFLGTDGNGYLLKTSVPDLLDPEDCFSEDVSQYLVVLNSSEVNVTEFVISKNMLTRGNTFFAVDVSAEPVHWPVPDDSTILVNKGVTKQVTVSTQGLTWYY